MDRLEQSTPTRNEQSVDLNTNDFVAVTDCVRKFNLAPHQAVLAERAGMDMIASFSCVLLLLDQLNKLLIGGHFRTGALREQRRTPRKTQSSLFQSSLLQYGRVERFLRVSLGPLRLLLADVTFFGADIDQDSGLPFVDTTVYSRCFIPIEQIGRPVIFTQHPDKPNCNIVLSFFT